MLHCKITSILALLMVSAYCHAVDACSSADRASALPISLFPASTDLKSRRLSTYKLTITDPIRTEPDETIEVIPDLSLSLSSGILSGRDDGEFGGELTYRKLGAADGVVLIEKNISAIYGGDHSALAIYSFSHMLKSEGKIFLFLAKNDVLKVCELASYDDQILEVKVDGGSLVYTVKGSYHSINSKLETDNNSLHSAH